jgi:hypothetical protein
VRPAPEAGEPIMSQPRALVAAARVAVVIGLGGLVPACGGESAAGYWPDAAANGGLGGDMSGADAAGAGGLADGTGGAGDMGDASNDQATDAGADAPAGPGNGSPCSRGDMCASGFCSDGVCCDQDCKGLCMTCAGATPGACTVAAAGTDSRNDCAAQPAASCGTTGVCDGAGACSVYPASTPCDSTPACNGTGTAVIMSRVCDGIGACVVDTVHDCQGFLCSSASCRTTCGGDGDCAPASLCSAGACVARVGNLAGNGDLEYGTAVGWSPLGATNVGLSDANGASGGSAHGGRYSVAATNRGHASDGPAYGLPTGAGRTVVTAWVLQKQDATLDGLLQVRLTCGSGTTTLAIGSAATALAQGVWTQLTGSIDTSTIADCVPSATAPGVTRAAALFVGQATPGTPVAFPDLYVDDLVVSVPDGHNLVGNASFEAGVTDGWSINGAGSLTVSMAAAHSGTQSLAVVGRTTSSAGPRYALPIAPAKYNVVLQARHAGATPHDLVLQPTYTCLGAAQVRPAPVVTAAAVAGNTWTSLAGTVTLPPVDAPAGCRLTQAAVFVQQEAGVCGTVECPDLYVDDVSITLAP